MNVFCAFVAGVFVGAVLIRVANRVHQTGVDFEEALLYSRRIASSRETPYADSYRYYESRQPSSGHVVPHNNRISRYFQEPN